MLATEMYWVDKYFSAFCSDLKYAVQKKCKCKLYINQLVFKSVSASVKVSFLTSWKWQC